MSYYIDSVIGKIYFDTHRKFSVVISNSGNFIHRQNVTFLDEIKFTQFSNLYQWSCMRIIEINTRYYLCIRMENNTFEMLNIYHDY